MTGKCARYKESAALQGGAAPSSPGRARSVTPFREFRTD